YDDWDRIGDWFNTLIDRVRNVAGVTSVGAVSSAPLGPELDTVIAYWTAEGGEIPPEQRPRARRRSVTPDFFKAAGVSLVAGRQFQESDRRDMPGVAIIDQVMARQLFGDRNPIGQRVVFRADPKPVQNPIGIIRPHQAEIVGVVRSIRFASLGANPEPTIYLPLEQVTRRQLIMVVATGLSDPLGLIAGVRDAVKQGDPSLSIEYYDMSRLIDRSLTRQRLSMALLVLFGLAALVLAAVGIYGIMAYSVAQRRGEFAVRAALGAEPGALRSLVLARGRTLGLIGVGTGVVVAVLVGRLVESQLFGVSALDPLVLSLMSLTMLAIVIASTLVPAIRASRVRAASVFRGE
ncbi:MAG TPA: ABC transporter permease, partial [Vicinamibacterales bacterium]|nr:ABC transporter permease [Vicinamibacterales bacterium]